MVPWLSEGKPTSGLFRKDVEIGMIAWGYEFLRSAHRFLGGCLNLSLVNVFQGIVLSLLVEGCETFHLVLEHVTRAWAAGELH